MKKVALIAGASGAVGSEILKDLCESEHYNKVVALVRHELEFTHEKLEVKIVNFDDFKDEVPFIARYSPSLNSFLSASISGSLAM